MARRTAKTAQEILLADFQTLVSDTEKLLDDTKVLAGDQADELRTKIHDSLLKARETLQLTEDSLRERGQAAVTATEDYVQANPWQSVGIAAGPRRTVWHRTAGTEGTHGQPATVRRPGAGVCAIAAGGVVDLGNDPGVGHRLPSYGDHLPLRVLHPGRSLLRSAFESGGIR
ncbi:hypothetical protein BHE74_00000596 [Ensete ventricosum]|nr:hypothetical protein BHE74_00000596 [Ensete ventricosum]